MKIIQNEFSIKLALSIVSEDDEKMIRTFCNDVDLEIDVYEATAEMLMSRSFSQVDVLIIDDEIVPSQTNQIISQLSGRHEHLSIIVLTRKSDRKMAVEAMKAGATDYIFKRDLNREIFEKSFRYCVEKSTHNREIEIRNSLIDSLFQQSKDAIFLIDGDWNLIDYNQELDKFFGQKLKGRKNLLELSKKEPFRNLEKALLSESFNDSTEIVVQNNGMRTYYTLTLREIDLQQLGSRKLGSIHNITSNKMAAAEQLRSEKLQLAARMARIMAHEVRNPLTNIRLSIDYISDLLKDDEEGAMYAEIIERNTERINSLIDDLLQSSKPFELKATDFKLSQLIENALTQTDDRRELLGINLEVDIHENLVCNGDLEKLVLVVVNLATNAFEAMAQSEEPRLRIETSNTGRILIIEISDNGKGMSDEVSEKLFDAFFTGRKGGMGLGMTTVKNIVDGHSGEIWISSEEGVGTTFKITLPIII